MLIEGGIDAFIYVSGRDNGFGDFSRIVQRVSNRATPVVGWFLNDDPDNNYQPVATRWSEWNSQFAALFDHTTVGSQFERHLFVSTVSTDPRRLEQAKISEAMRWLVEQVMETHRLGSTDKKQWVAQ